MARRTIEVPRVSLTAQHSAPIVVHRASSEWPTNGVRRYYNAVELQSQKEKKNPPKT